MPAKLVLRSAMGSSQHLIYPLRRRHPLRRGIHDLRATIRAIAAVEHLRMILRPAELRALTLTDRDDHHVARNRLGAVCRFHFQPGDGAVADDALWGGMESESAPGALGQLGLIVVAGHGAFARAIDSARRHRPH